MLLFPFCILSSGPWNTVQRVFYCSSCSIGLLSSISLATLILILFFFTIVLIDLISPRCVHVICLSNSFLLWFEKGFFLLIFSFNFFFVALCKLFWHSPLLGFATNYLLSRSRDELSHYFENDELHGVYADTHTHTHSRLLRRVCSILNSVIHGHMWPTSRCAIY